MKKKEKFRVLIVDDEKTFRNHLAKSLASQSLQINTASSGIECIKELKNNPPDILITDMVLPDITGLKILELAKQISPATDVIMITGYATMDTAIKALKMGASDYITKPVNVEELKILINKYLDKKTIIKENVQLLSKFKLVEELRGLTIYNNLEGFFAYLSKIISNYLNISRTVGFVIQKERLSIIAFSGVSKKYAQKLCKEISVKKLANLLPGKYDLITKKTYNTLLLSLGGRRKKGYMLLQMKSEGSLDLKTEYLEEILAHATVYFRTITDIDEARYLSYIDDLTELYNPRYLKVSLKRAIKQSAGTNNHFALLFIDLDHFKEVNDTYGHLVGGQLLCEVAKVLKNSVRNADIVVRYGGDEYVIVLFNTNKQKALTVAERIRKNIENHVFLGREGYRIRLTACIGIAVYPDDAKTYKKLIDFADRAMYIGKEETRNTIHLADDLKQRNRWKKN